MITLKELKQVPREKHKTMTISDVYVPHNAKWELPPEEEAIKALETMIKEDVGRLVVRQEDKIAGLITRNGIARYVQLMGK
jgi:predicted transcriptional regulator